jgi:2-desacetyl-2-hydroxyethyl bacteriochlorophyllide A dehydrogenase
MKAVRYYAPDKPLKIEEVPIPQIEKNEVLIKVRAAGLCHTDLHFIDGTLAPWKGLLPLTLGHEVAGDIVKIGKEIKNFKEGDKVIVSNIISCDNCYYCHINHENLCSNLDQIGFTVDGGYAEYVKTIESTLIKLPNNVSYEAGSVLTCAAASCYHALVSIAKAKTGQTVLLNGFGGLGSNALQIAHALGLQVIVVDISKEKLKVASEMGAKATINATNGNVSDEVKKATNGEGVDIALEFVGRSKTIENAFKSLRKQGSLVFIGYTKDNFTFNPLELIISELSVKGSVAYTKDDLVNVVKLAEEQKIKPIISKTFNINDTNKALQEIAKGKIMGISVIKLGDS